MARLVAQIADPRTYLRVLYLLLALPIGIVELTFLVTGISLGIGLAVVTVGVPILVAVIVASRWLAKAERRLAHVLIGVEIAPPYRPLPPHGRWEQLKAFLSDPASWRDLVFLLLRFPLGVVSFVVAATVVQVALGALTAPVWYWAPPDGIELGLVQVDSLVEAVALVPFGAVAVLVGLPGLNLLARLYGRFAELLLGADADPELSAQVTELRGSRARVIAAADAERRRLERDLHDGAQQRLVSLALTLRMAEQRVAGAGADAEDAGELVRRAGEEAQLALEELRDLARGIHPAILTNRGLGAALDDLAARSSVPVTIDARPDGRLPEQVEAAAYFIVSESLVNAAKHAQASGATVSAAVEGDVLLVEVRDDGVGGATSGSGSGLQGLEDRVGALDGTLAIESAPGDGTRVLARIPLSAESGLDASAPRALPQAAAEERDARRLRHLRLRLAPLGGTAALLLAIWWLTGTVSDWIVWPLLGLGLVAAVDAWLVAANPTLRTSDLPAGADRGRAAHELRARRTGLLLSGVVAIVNLAIVGVWITAGAGYFWPAWVLLGSAVVVGLLALVLKRHLAA